MFVKQKPLFSADGKWFVGLRDYVPVPGPSDFLNGWNTPEEAIHDVLDFYFQSNNVRTKTMITMKPLLLITIGPGNYRVRFQRDSGEVEYTFTVSEADTPFPVLHPEHDFSVATYGDAGVDFLMRSILSFHEATRTDEPQSPANP